MHIHEAILIDDDNPNIAKGKGISKVLLEKGFHPVKLITKQLAKGENLKLELKWTGSGFQNEALPVYYQGANR
jgi:uncharacterized sulfatase